MKIARPGKRCDLPTLVVHPTRRRDGTATPVHTISGIVVYSQCQIVCNTAADGKSGSDATAAASQET